MMNIVMAFWMGLVCVLSSLVLLSVWGKDSFKFTPSAFIGTTLGAVLVWFVLGFIPVALVKLSLYLLAI